MIKADVAELVDARDLKFPATTEGVAIFCKTLSSEPVLSAPNPRVLQNTSDRHFVDHRTRSPAKSFDVKELLDMPVAPRGASGIVYGTPSDKAQFTAPS
jgi:hypothetical protein